MKVGYSFGKCIASIVRGEVALDDVLVIVAQTHMRSEYDIPGVIDSYLKRPSYLMGLDRAECIKVGVALWESGKVHQPRALGVWARPVPQVWDTIASAESASEPTSANPVVNAFEVIVSNVGTVYSGNDRAQAGNEYNDWVRLSEGTQGRASGESVTIMADGSPAVDHTGTLYREEE